MSIIAIEHLEKRLWRWLYLEYLNASHYAEEELIICNLPAKYHKYFPNIRVYRESVLQLYSTDRLIILDPQADKTISPEDVDKNSIIVVGGILGSHPPMGRTKSLLTDRAPNAKCFNLGKQQLTIDGAVYVAKKIIDGKKLSEINFIDSINIETTWNSVVILPYRYPIDKTPIISDVLVDLIKKYGLPNSFDNESESIWGDLYG
jgi:ribosome biogenesis SPOUT family RNA methylase Rps3